MNTNVTYLHGWFSQVRYTYKCVAPSFVGSKISCKDYSTPDNDAGDIYYCMHVCQAGMYVCLAVMHIVNIEKDASGHLYRRVWS
jgi:hypothetical protein